MVVERNGGKLGGVPVQVIREDSQLKPEVATQIVDKLIEKEKVPIITGITFSNVMMAVHKKITDKEVFLIGSNAGPVADRRRAVLAVLLLTSWQNDNQAEVVGKYATDKGYKKVIGMAPNYQAGKDFIAGFKRFYTRRAGQRDLYAAQPAGLLGRARADRRGQARRGLRVLSRRPRRQLRRQYKQAGLMGKVPLLSTSTTDGIDAAGAGRCRARRDLRHVLGPGLQQPGQPASSSRTSRRSTTASRRSTRRSRTTPRCCSTRRSRKVKGNVADKKAFRAALKAADFKTVRGDFKFNNNNFPIQDLHVFEVAKDAKGRMSLKTIATPLKDQQDAYHAQCTMK